MADQHETPPRDELLKGLWRENPVFIQVLGTCPTLAVSNTARNALAMGLATLFVLIGSATAAEAASRVFIIHGIPGVAVYVYASPAGGAIPSVPTSSPASGRSRLSTSRARALQPTTSASSSRVRIRRPPRR